MAGAGEYVLTEDALRDLAGIEDYVSGYADEGFVERLEDEFFDLFDRLRAEGLRYPIYQFDSSVEPLHEYRSANIYRYKVFFYLRDDAAVIYRIRRLASDFTRLPWDGTT